MGCQALRTYRSSGEGQFEGGETSLEAEVHFQKFRAWSYDGEVELNMQFYFHFHSAPRRKCWEIDCMCIKKSVHERPLARSRTGVWVVLTLFWANGPDCLPKEGSLCNHLTWVTLADDRRAAEL